MRTSKYVLVQTESSFCPKCLKSIVLLTHDGLHKPSFYICFPCKLVAQVGVGEVKEEKS